MKLDKFKKLIDAAVEFAGDVAKYADVEITVGEKAYAISEVRQFSVKPDVIIYAENPIEEIPCEEGK